MHLQMRIVMLNRLLTVVCASQQTRLQLGALMQTLKAGAQHLLEGCQAAMAQDELDDELITDIRQCAAEMKAR